MRVSAAFVLVLSFWCSLAVSVKSLCSGSECSSDAAIGEQDLHRGAIPKAPCQPEALSVTETTVQLVCSSRQTVLTSPTKLPATDSASRQLLQFGGRLSLELRQVDDGSGGENAEQQPAWSTRIESVTQLPVQLERLAPFTRYEVRFVAWSSKNQLLNIGDPGSFATLESQAAPSTEPQSLTAAWTTESARTVRVSWRPPNMTNSRLTGYTLKLEQWIRESADAGSPPDVTHSEFVRQGPALLDAPVCSARAGGSGCRVRINLAAVNRHGAGPAARVEVVQPESKPTTARLLLQVGGALKLVAVPGPPRYSTLVSGNDTAGIVAFAVDAHQQLLFSVDHLGSLSRRSLPPGGDSAFFELPRVRQKVVKLAVDWVAQRVYIVTKPGDILLAKDWYGASAAEVEPTKIGEAPVIPDRRLRSGQLQLQVDPINGYLFLLLDSCLYRSDLPRGSSHLNWTRLPAGAEAGDSPQTSISAFRVLPGSQRLLLIPDANLSSVMSGDLSGRGVALETKIDGASSTRPIVRRLLRLPDGRLVWTDGSMVGFDRSRLRQRSGSIRELECAEPACQPKPTPLTPPRLEVFCGLGGAFARVRLPEPQGEQSDSAFRKWRIGVWTSDSPTTLHQPVLPAASTRRTSPSSVDIGQFVNLPQLAPTASVSAVAFYDRPPSLPPSSSSNSLWSRPVVCARQQRRNYSSSVSEFRLFAMTKTTKTVGYAYRLQRLDFNETSMAEPRVAACQETSWHGHHPAYMSAMGSSRVWVASEAGDWMRVDVAESSCQWRSSRTWRIGVQHMEFEWLSGSLLWIGDDASIYRSQPDGSRRLLHRTAATHFTLLTSRALLLWSTTNQVWAGSLSGGAKRLLIELPQPQRLVSTFISAIHVEESGARSALDLAFSGAQQLESQHRIFYAVFSGDNSAALFSALLTVHSAFGDVNCSASGAGFVATLHPFDRYSQVQVLGNKVLWSHRRGISISSLGGADGFFNDSFLLASRSALLPFAVVRDNDTDLLSALAIRNLSVIPSPVNASLLTKRFPSDRDGELLVEWPESSPPGLTRYLVRQEINGRNRTERLLDRSWLRLTEVPPLAAVRLEITPLTAWASSPQSLNVTIVAPIAAPQRPVNLTVYRHPKPGSEGASDAQLCWSPPDLANSRAHPVQEYRVTLRITSSSPDFGQRWSKHRVGRQRTCFGATLGSPDQIACFSVAACNSRGCTASDESTEQQLNACSDGERFDRTDSLRVSTDKPGDISGTRRDLTYEYKDAAGVPTRVRQSDVTAFTVKRHHARIFYAIGRQLFTSPADLIDREVIYSRAMSNDSVTIYWMGFDWLRDNLLWLESANSLRSLQRTRLMLIEFGRLPQATVVLETVGQPADVELLVVDRQLRFRRVSGNYQSLDLDHLIPSDSLSRFAVGAYSQRDFQVCSESLRLRPEDWALCDTDAELNASLLLLRGSWDLCEVSSVGNICACLPVTGAARQQLIQYDLVICEVPDVAGDRSLVRILSVRPESTAAPGPVAAAQQQVNLEDQPPIQLEQQQQQQQQQQLAVAAYSLNSILVERSNGQLLRTGRSFAGATPLAKQTAGLRRVCYSSTSVVASLTGVSVGLATAEVIRPSQSGFTMLLRDVKSDDRISPTSVTMFSISEGIQLKLNFSTKLLPGSVYEPILSQPQVADSDENLAGCRFRSAATPPDPPSRVRFDSKLGLLWEAARPNGSPVIGYELSLVAANASDGTVVYWKRLPNVTRFAGDSAILSWAAAVQIAAVNWMGQSAPSPPVPIPMAVAAVRYSESGLSFVTLTLLGALVLLLLGSLPLLAYFLCKRSPKPSTVQIPLAPVLSQEYVDLGLASEEDELRRLQDALRRQQPTQDAAAVAATAGSLLAVMTRVSKRQVNVVRFLGSGAFGQVFEGFVRLQASAPQKHHSHGASAAADDSEDSEELPCAVKMVKKTASAQEKADFLREAALASRFDHRHIVRCLGVCVDSDPHFILLELMEGGDLLGFLRRSRGCPSDPCAKLSLASVVKIILDVAHGCCYLESQKFVHRDIAARNCLVTQRSGELLVKIGDFGLARDVYRSDYYKKDVGRAMLPVRWMSPEALTDGMFSTQSDVWAFGVLCWESLTLGQQPYAGKSNGEVLRYVRSGGILEQPSNAPEPLYHMMLSCWKHDPSHRPNFTEILQCVEGFHVQSRDSNSPFAGPMNNRCSAVSGMRSRHASSVYHNQHGSATGLTAQTSLTSLGSLEGAVGGCTGSPIQYTTLMLREGQQQQQQQQQFCTVRSPALGRVNISAEFGSPRSRPPLPPSQLVQQQQQKPPRQHLHYIAPLLGTDEESDAEDEQPNQPLTSACRTRVPDGHSSSGDDDEYDADSGRADDEEENLRRPFLPASVARSVETSLSMESAAAGGGGPAGGARRPLMGVAAFQTRPVPQSPQDFC